MGKKETVSIDLKVEGADTSAIDVGKVSKAFESMGSEGAKAATPITTALQSIQAGIDRYNQKIESGKAVTQKEVNAMAQQYARLEEAIDESGQSVGDFPAEVQQAFAQAKTHVDRATEDFGRLNDSVKDNATKARVAAGEWPGLGNAIEAQYPKLGNMTKGVGQYAAAAGEGWAIGKKWAEQMGTDFTEMDKISSSFWNRIGTVIRAFSDSLVHLGFLVQAFISGDVAAIKRAMKDLDEASLAFNKSLKDSLTMSVAEFEKAHPAVKKHSDAIRDDADAVNHNSQAVGANAAAKKAHADATNAQAEATAKHTVIVDLNTRTVTDNSKSTIQLSGGLLNTKTSGDEAAATMKKLSEQQGGAATAADLAGKSIGQLARKDVTEADIKINQLKASTTAASTALDGATKAATPAAGAVATMSKAAGETATAAGEAATKVASLNTNLSALITMAPAVVAALNTINAAASSAATALNQAATASARAAGGGSAVPGQPVSGGNTTGLKDGQLSGSAAANVMRD